MWKEIKKVWKKQWRAAKSAWKSAWDCAKESICNAVYSIANFIWAIIQTVIFLPIKTGIYETGKIIIKYLIKLIMKI